MPGAFILPNFAPPATTVASVEVEAQPLARRYAVATGRAPGAFSPGPARHIFVLRQGAAALRRRMGASNGIKLINHLAIAVAAQKSIDHARQTLPL